AAEAFMDRLKRAHLLFADALGALEVIDADLLIGFVLTDVALRRRRGRGGTERCQQRFHFRLTEYVRHPWPLLRACLPFSTGFNRLLTSNVSISLRSEEHTSELQSHLNLV